MYKRILVAVDGSKNSERAAEHAAGIAASNPEVHVEVLYVVDFDRTRKEATPKTNDEFTFVDKKNILGPIKGVFEKRRVNYELVTKQGEPGSTIVSFANRGGFDLVVIGSRGLNSFQKMMLGSVSLKVARRVKAPVLIIK